MTLIFMSLLSVVNPVYLSANLMKMVRHFNYCRIS